MGHARRSYSLPPLNKVCGNSGPAATKACNTRNDRQTEESFLGYYYILHFNAGASTTFFYENCCWNGNGITQLFIEVDTKGRHFADDLF